MPLAVNSDANILPLFKGRTTEITLPSGRKVVIRETNGEDEEILSSLLDSKDGSNILKFLSAICVSDSTKPNNGKPLPNDIQLWPINDKYGLLYKQRLFVYGKELKFKATCIECKEEYEYVEDLGKWEDPKDPNCLKPYPRGFDTEVEFVTSSHKKFQYKILNGELEKRALELADTTKNSPLIIRDLQIFNAGDWEPVRHFAAFSSKEMGEIRSNIKMNDAQFDPLVEFTCNNPKCKHPYSFSLFSLGSFFYPEEYL